MGRVILDSVPEIFFAGSTKRTEPDHKEETTYSERLVKFIPAEVLAGYIFVGAHTSQFETRESKIIFLLVLIATCLVAIPIQYGRLIPRGRKARKHVLISCGAFVVWAYAIGGPFAAVGWHHPAIASLVMVMFTFLTPLIKP